VRSARGTRENHIAATHGWRHVVALTPMGRAAFVAFADPVCQFHVARAEQQLAPQSESPWPAVV
jgi:hypothetical protein